MNSAAKTIETIVAATSGLFPLGITLNIMSLAGLTVAIGRVVDDSIVVLENIYRHIQQGRDRKEAVLIGTRDVSIAILASTVTTVVVFLPIGLLGGIVGQFFLPFAVAVTYALISSFFVAVTVIPVLAFMFIRKEHLPEEKETGMQRRYTPIDTRRAVGLNLRPRRVRPTAFLQCAPLSRSVSQLADFLLAD